MSQDGADLSNGAPGIDLVKEVSDTHVSPSLRRIIAVCAGALFAPLLLPLATNRLLVLNDLGAYHIPMRFLYATALDRGDSVLWTPAVYGGYYLFGEGQLGMAHPWHLLLYRTLPLVAAFNVELVASYGLLFVGVVLLLQRLGLARESSWFGAMVFTFSGYTLFHVIHPNLIAVVAHIPWLLLAAWQLMFAPDRKTAVRAFIAVALIFASQLLLGHPQQVWFGLIAVACLSLATIWSGKPLAASARLAPGFLVCAIIAGVQVMPLLDAVESSQRTAWSADLSLTYSLLPINVVQLWSPFFFKYGVRTVEVERLQPHEFIVYNGAFCTVALAWIAMRWEIFRKRTVVVGLVLVCGLALVLAFGRYGGLYPALLELPFFGWFRAPTRHLMLWHFSLSILAALVFEDLVRMSRLGERLALRQLWPLFVPSALSLGTM